MYVLCIQLSINLKILTFDRSLKYLNHNKTEIHLIKYNWKTAINNKK